MSEWKKFRFDELCDITRGASPRPIHDYLGTEGMPWIKIADATKASSRFIESTNARIKLKGVEASVRVYPGDLILSNSATPGIPKFVSIDACIHDGWMLLRNFRNLDKNFAYWLLTIQRSNLVAQGNGSVFTNLKTEILKSHIVSIPSTVGEQKRIAGVLDSIENKIDLNRKINLAIESIAQSHFKDWFIDFGPTRTKIIEQAPYLAPEIWSLFPKKMSASGIPEGWRIDNLGAHILNFDSKRIPVSGREREQRKGPFPYHGATGVMGNIDEFLFDGIYLLIGEDGSVMDENGTAVTQYVWGKFWANNHAHVLQGKGAVSTEQLLLYFKHETVAPYITGAVQLKLSQGRMNSMPFLYCGEALCEKFKEQVSPLFERIRANLEENRTLSSTRDMLLPKLMSGELRVKDAAEFVRKTK